VSESLHGKMKYGMVVWYLLFFNMQEHTITSLVPKTSRTPFYFAITLLILTLAMSIGFFFRNIILTGNIEDEKDAITQVRKQIDEVSQDRNVIITKIVMSNTIRPSIDLKGLESGFRDAAFRANVRLKGFSVTNDVISTTLIATQADGIAHPDPAGTIIKMMREYAAGNGQTFALEPITTIA
jgi:hypothetical protein